MCECGARLCENTHIFCLKNTITWEEKTVCFKCWQNNETQMRIDGWICDEDYDPDDDDLSAHDAAMRPSSIHEECDGTD